MKQEHVSNIGMRLTDYCFDLYSYDYDQASHVVVAFKHAVFVEPDKYLLVYETMMPPYKVESKDSLKYNDFCVPKPLL
jgi:hypothetical protein